MTQAQWMHTDAIIACADLVDRAGGRDFEIGYIHDDVPIEEAGWYAHATYVGARLTTQDHRSPSAAALGLAERILAGGQCKCGQKVTLTDYQPGCRWQLMGQRWVSGCDAPAIRIDGERGDIAGMQRAVAARDAQP